MIAENREQTGVNNYPEDCIQFLEKYLRSTMDYASMNNKTVHDAVEQRLIFTVKDYGTKRNFDVPDNDAASIANEAIDRFMDNWKGKESGTDDRGHRLGKSW